MAKLHITALGSSFASGPGIESMEHRPAGRSSRNYAHQLAKELDAQLTDLTVAGASLLNVLNEPQYLGRERFDPQLDHLPTDADIITLTCGGNDIGYIGCLMQDSLMAYLGQPNSSSPNGPTAPFLDLHQLTSRLLAVLDKIHEIAPRAKVDVALTVDQMRHYEDVASLLAQAYNQAAVARPYVEIVPVAERSRQHGLGSKDQWVDGFNLSMVVHGQPTYHPNLAGHTAVAEILRQRIINDCGSF